VKIKDGIRVFLGSGFFLGLGPFVPGSFGALRVMVNLNQLGEAAGVAAWLALQEDKTIQTVDGRSVQRILRQGGSI
jgi:hypothetical protein